jgi:hypothetical protein
MELFARNVSPVACHYESCCTYLLTSAVFRQAWRKIHTDQHLKSFDRPAHFTKGSGHIPRDNIAAIIQEAYTNVDEQNISEAVDRNCSKVVVHAEQFLRIVVMSGCPI